MIRTATVKAMTDEEVIFTVVHYTEEYLKGKGYCKAARKFLYKRADEIGVVKKELQDETST